MTRPTKPPRSKGSRSTRSTKHIGRPGPTAGRKATQLKVFGLKKNPYTIIKKLMKREGESSAREVLWEEGEFLAAKVRDNILAQRLPMPDLNPAYLAWKLRNGLDPRKLIAAGDYVSEIQPRWKRGKTVVEVGVPDEVHPSGLSYEVLARIHEYGQRKWQMTGKGIPARPHWRPTIAWWKKRRKRKVIEEIEDRVKQKVWKKLQANLGSDYVKRLK